MHGIFLKLYVAQTAKHGKALLYEWLLGEARAIGIPGGSAFRSVASYGRHGHMHEEHFFELAGTLPMTVEFFAESALIDRLLERLREENIPLFYIRLPVEGGMSAT